MRWIELLHLQLHEYVLITWQRPLTSTRWLIKSFEGDQMKPVLLPEGRAVPISPCAVDLLYAIGKVR